MAGASPTGRASTAHHPIVIAGAGPVGLVAALDLASKGHRTVVIDKKRNLWKITVHGKPYYSTLESLLDFTAPPAAVTDVSGRVGIQDCCGAALAHPARERRRAPGRARGRDPRRAASRNPAR